LEMGQKITLSNFSRNRSVPPGVSYGTAINFTVPAAYQATTG
jgi:hypothetical protein